MVTFELEGGQAPLDMVQLKTFCPTIRPVIVVVGDNEFVMVPKPETNDQAPVPITGMLAAIVAVGLRIQII